MFGEGEWNVRQHGPSKRRTWRKLHLAIDPDTQEILAEALTTNAGHDADQAAALLAEVPGKINSVTADGGYDQWKVYDAIDQHGARPKIAPPTQRQDQATRQHGWTSAGSRRGPSRDPPHRAEELEKEH